MPPEAEPIVTAAVPAVVASEPAVAPAPVAAVEPSPAASPSPEAAASPQAEPAREAPAATEEVTPPGREPTLLEKYDAEQAEKAKNAKPEAEPTAKAEEAPKPAETAAPTYQEFKLPEGFAADAKKIGAYTEVLGKYGISQEAGQNLIDLHGEALREFAKARDEGNVKAWNDLVGQWGVKSMADAEFGGAGHDTAIGAIARVRDQLVSSAKRGSERYAKDVAELNEFLNLTGGGSHPAFLRILHNAARYVDEARKPPPTDAKPPADIGDRPGRGLRDLYTHPRSPSSMNGRSA